MLRDLSNWGSVLYHFDPTGQSALVFASTGNLLGLSFFSPRSPKCSRTMSSSESRPLSRWLSNHLRRRVASGISLILNRIVTCVLLDCRHRRTTSWIASPVCSDEHTTKYLPMHISVVMLREQRHISDEQVLELKRLTQGADRLGRVLLGSCCSEPAAKAPPRWRPPQSRFVVNKAACATRHAERPVGTSCFGGRWCYQAGVIGSEAVR